MAIVYSRGGETTIGRPRRTASVERSPLALTVRPSWSATDSVLSLPVPVTGSRGTL